MDIVAGVVAADEVQEEAGHGVGFFLGSRLVLIHRVEDVRDPAVEPLELGGLVVFQRVGELALHLPELVHHDADHGYLP